MPEQLATHFQRTSIESKPFSYVLNRFKPKAPHFSFTLSTVDHPSLAQVSIKALAVIKLPTLIQHDFPSSALIAIKNPQNSNFILTMIVILYYDNSVACQPSLHL